METPKHHAEMVDVVCSRNMEYQDLCMNLKSFDGVNRGDSQIWAGIHFNSMLEGKNRLDLNETTKT